MKKLNIKLNSYIVKQCYTKYMFTKLQKAVYLYPVQCINWLLWEPEFQMLFDGCLHNTTMSARSIPTDVTVKLRLLLIQDPCPFLSS